MGDDFAFLKNVSMRVREPRVPADAHSGEVLAVRSPSFLDECLLRGFARPRPFEIAGAGFSSSETSAVMCRHQPPSTQSCGTDGQPRRRGNSPVSTSEQSQLETGC